MKTSHWIGVIAVLSFFFGAWELNRSDSLGVAMWVAYVTLSILAFTAAWISIAVCGVIWVYRLAMRGHIEERIDIATGRTKVI